MCGIAGYFGLDDGEALLRRMNDAQSHRGPDGEGYAVDGLIGLAHRRLAIIDRAHGQQPLFSADKTLVIIYNGEIYNYRELKSELEKAGYTFVTDTDTEVVVQAYAAWGEAAFERFNGMFAFALYDKKTSRLLLVRDHFGIKPLYFVRLSESKVLFASEIKTLLATDKFARKPSERAIYRYLRFRAHEDLAETFFEGINKLMPGEMMVCDSSGVLVKPYTHLRQELVDKSEENYPYDPDKTQEYQERLRQAVKARLMSEVPVGTSFSGGLDSSTIVALINQLMQQDQEATRPVGVTQNTFSAVFPSSANDEERYVDALLSHCQGRVTVHKIKPTADEFIQDLTDFIRTQEEPLISTGPYAQYKVMQTAAKHVTVLLDGQGADETMAGYVPYYFVYLRQLLKRGLWLKFVIEVVSSADIFLRFARVNLSSKLFGKLAVLVADLLADEFKAKYQNETFEVIADNLKLRLIDDLFRNSLPALLRYEDKNTMRFSIEGRVPFLDKEVLKFLFSLNDDAIILHGWNKRILRDATRGLLPELISRRRNKIGFTTPEDEWFMRLKSRFYGIFMSESFIGRPYFNQPAVVAAFEGFIQGKNDTTSLLFWRFLNVELWLREFFDPKATETPESTKTDLEPNQGKSLDIAADGGTYRRYSLRTKPITAGDDLQSLVGSRLRAFFERLPQVGERAAVTQKDWYLLISEKIVAITQGRSYFIWDIKPSWWARTLSSFVTKTPHGIGLGSPWTMQLAIQEAGLLRILWAAAVSAIGKPFGHRGLFYNLVGSDIRSIDGPTEYSVYPSNVSAKLAPKDPAKVAAQLSQAVRDSLDPKFTRNFKGCVVIDSNDLGRNILGKDVSEPDQLFEDIFADNPLGQSREMTPLAVVVRL